MADTTVAQRRSAWSMLTPMLLFSCFCMLVGDMLFGYDTASFGGILGNPGFVRRFGQYNEATGKWAIPALNTSLLSSLSFIGKFVGCLAASPAIERFGHRMVFYGLSAISTLGVIVEITVPSTGAVSGRIAQFIAGRIIVYVSIGLVEVTVTTYQSEIVPASFRGLVVVSLQLFLNVGQVIATGVNKALSTRVDASGWQTVTGVQLIFPLLIIVFTYFMVDSPRWLLSLDRNEEAISTLRRLRPKEDVDSGICELEIHAIREALRQHVHKGPWVDLIRGTNLRRTMLVMAFYFFQQATGQAFVGTYQTTFFKTNGYANQAFTYPVISSCLTVVAVMPLMYLVDKLGRRDVLMISFGLQALFMYILAGVGRMADKSPAEKNLVVAAFILFTFFYNMGGASVPYLLGSEIPNAAIREKTQALGAAWNVIWAFVTNFCIPYMIKKIHFEVGFVFGSVAAIALGFTFLFLPETKGQALEELDAVFAGPYNPFRPPKVQYSEAELAVGRMQRDKRVPGKIDEFVDETEEDAPS